MTKSAITVLMIFTVARSFSQNVQFETKFSEPFAVFQFMYSLSGRSPVNVYKSLFNRSIFHNKTYEHLIIQFDSLNLNYACDFTGYPPGQKISIDVPNLLKRNLIICDSLQDSKIRSMGLLPNENLIKLLDLLKQF